ncbi:hypothetical protein [Pseudonocardia acaciae]|uniref:hypothetical protein n=1 Tax=Pseudonocardia acaciae TaxID=551276 RepID=UPI001B8017CD|nr:hypothetical protein [Pseudonocardia acaciae]
MEQRLDAFRAKFGRDPGPKDPIFFDPHASEPQPLSPGAWTAELDRLIGEGDGTGVDPAKLNAARDLGYIVTEENQHLFSAAEVEAWESAVERYWEENADDSGIGDLVALLADELEAAVERTLVSTRPEPAREFATRVTNTDIAAAEEDEDAEALGTSIAFAIVAAWLTGARDELSRPTLAADAVGWVESHLGAEAADLARRGAGILGAPESGDLTAQELADETGDDFIPTMIWLAAGVAAVCGGGDAGWLRRYDVSDPD